MEKWILKNMNVVKEVTTEVEAAKLKDLGYKVVEHIKPTKPPKNGKKSKGDPNQDGGEGENDPNKNTNPEGEGE